MEPRQLRRIDSGGASSGKRFPPDRLDLDRTAVLPIDQARRLVGTHLAGALDVRFGEVGFDLVSFRGGDGDDFGHERPNARSQFPGGENLPCIDSARRNRKPIEGNVPDQLAPAGQIEIGKKATVDAGFLEQGDDRWGRPGFGRFAHLDLPVGEMTDDARFAPIDADETHPAEDGAIRTQLREQGFVSETILERDDRGILVEKGREQSGKNLIRRGLQRDDDEIDRPDFFRRREGSNRIEMEIAIRTLDTQPTRADCCEVAAHQECGVANGGELRSVVAANCTCADDGNVPDLAHPQPTYEFRAGGATLLTLRGLPVECGMSIAESILDAERVLVSKLAGLRFSEPVTHVYNPLVYASAPHQAYVRRFANSTKRVLFMGMNPGPWGMAQTGVPFGEIPAVRDWMGIEEEVGKPDLENPKRPIEGFTCTKSEVSGRRLWGHFAEQYPEADDFFRDHYVLNYCPLVWMEETGRNRTPDKLPVSELAPVTEACDEAVLRHIEVLKPQYLVGVGAFAETCLRRVAEPIGFEGTIGKILHPSPASPAANRGWSEAAAKQLRELGVSG